MIRVENLVKTFGEFTAVDHVSFEVGKGEIFAFLGPNGAGKTTTIKMLTTLLRPTSGTLDVDGLDPGWHSNEVRKRFGIVFQDPSLDGDMTAYENMEGFSTTCRVSFASSESNICCACLSSGSGAMSRSRSFPEA
jgi:ABC-2 type transport system ATP-binding protein